MSTIFFIFLCLKHVGHVVLTLRLCAFIISVTCVQHVFEEHIVFQFNCTNTISEQVLEKVSVLMDVTEAVREFFVFRLMLCLISSFI